MVGGTAKRQFFITGNRRVAFSQKGRTMSLNGFRTVSKIALCASLALLTVATAPLLAKDRSESGGPGFTQQHRPLHHLKRVTLPNSSYYQIFEKAQCIADCGDHGLALHRAFGELRGRRRLHGHGRHAHGDRLLRPSRHPIGKPRGHERLGVRGPFPQALPAGVR